MQGSRSLIGSLVYKFVDNSSRYVVSNIHESQPVSFLITVRFQNISLDSVEDDIFDPAPLARFRMAVAGTQPVSGSSFWDTPLTLVGLFKYTLMPGEATGLRLTRDTTFVSREWTPTTNLALIHDITHMYPLPEPVPSGGTISSASAFVDAPQIKVERQAMVAYGYDPQFNRLPLRPALKSDVKDLSAVAIQTGTATGLPVTTGTVPRNINLRWVLRQGAQTTRVHIWVLLFNAHVRSIGDILVSPAGNAQILDSAVLRVGNHVLLTTNFILSPGQSLWFTSGNAPNTSLLWDETYGATTVQPYLGAYWDPQ